VFFSASALAASISPRGSMQLSTTTRASFVVPSSRTRQRAWSGSCAAVALRSDMPPLTETGKVAGVTSCANAPARSRAGLGGLAGTATAARSAATEQPSRQRIIGSSSQHAAEPRRGTERRQLLRFQIVAEGAQVREQVRHLAVGELVEQPGGHQR